MKPSVEGYVAAVLELVDSESLGSVAAELDAVHQLVLSNLQLQVALTDTAVPAIARRGLVDDLLRDRVSEPTRRAAVFVAGTVYPPEVPSALAWVAMHARHVAEGDLLVEPVHALGHLQARARVGGFADAVFEDLSTAELEEVEDEVFRFARILESAPSLRIALSDRDLPAPARSEIAHSLLDGKVQAATLRLVDYTIEAGRSRDLVGTLDFLADRAARARGWRVARVRAGQPVDAEQHEHLSSSLTALTGKPVELQLVVDPNLLGGVLVQIGDLQVDATARGRLNNLREHLMGQEWAARGFDLADGSNSETSTGSS